MRRAPQKRWFPPWLTFMLLAPLPLFMLTYLMKGRNPLVPLFVGASLVIGLIGAPIAIYHLGRSEYRSAGNVIITLAGAVPLVLVSLGVLVFFFGNVHF